jgi:hypothetical protein
LLHCHLDSSLHSHPMWRAWRDSCFSGNERGGDVGGYGCGCDCDCGYDYVDAKNPQCDGNEGGCVAVDVDFDVLPGLVAVAAAAASAAADQGPGPEGVKTQKPDRSSRCVAV